MSATSKPQAQYLKDYQEREKKEKEELQAKREEEEKQKKLRKKRDLVNDLKRLIEENDVDIYNWIIGVSNTPEIYNIMIEKIRSVVGFKVK